LHPDVSLFILCPLFFAFMDASIDFEHETQYVAVEIGNKGA